MPRITSTDLGLFVFRAGFASLLIGFHGWARLLQASSYVVLGQPWPFVSVVERLGFPAPPVFAVLSVLSESLGALLIGLGLFTRSASTLLAFNMAVAVYNEATTGDPYELPALYLLGAVALALMGSGSVAFRESSGGLPFLKKQRWTGE